MVTAPHFLASQAGLAILEEGGTAIEAAVAAAATIAVCYPHMNSLGGDGFWLIRLPGGTPIAIDACGRAATTATVGRYRDAGHATVPVRGPLAANTVAGTISGWEAALTISHARQKGLPLTRLFRDAIEYASAGFAVTPGFTETLTGKRAELERQPGFAGAFLPRGEVLQAGATLRQPRLADALRALAADGLASFYRGDLADSIARDLDAAGSPVSLADLEQHRATISTPLHAQLKTARLYNLPPPTQGVASLLILALFDRLDVTSAEGFAHLHGLIECTKRAFRFRDAAVGDPAYMSEDVQGMLDDAAALDRIAAGIDRSRALPWPQSGPPADTVWLGVADASGCAVSMIQSTYFEFGSGVVLPETGITWQNRGASFRLADDGWNALRPGRKPFHTLNPAMARLGDGRWMTYGTMGGEGQPQTQAAIFSRYALFGQALQEAVSAPRWLLGKTWGDATTGLKMESRFPEPLLQQLRAAGHIVESVAPFSSVMGHAGAIVQHPDGTLEGASDPRSDGAVAAS